MDIQNINSTLVQDIRTIIEEGRRQAYAAINMAMLATYWNVGRRIVEEEQHGEERAEYGKFIAHKVADALSEEYGDTYNYRNICYFRQFYLCFKDLQIVNSRVHNLTWTHFRHLLRVEDPEARLWYMNEASTQLWSRYGRRCGSLFHAQRERSHIPNQIHALPSNQGATEVGD